MYEEIGEVVDTWLSTSSPTTSTSFAGSRTNGRLAPHLAQGDWSERKRMTDTNRPADVGFHAGELAVQARAGVAHQAGRLSGMLAPVALDEGIAEFLADRTFLVITGRDGLGQVWTSPLVGPPGFLQVLSDTKLAVRATIPKSDPLS